MDAKSKWFILLLFMSASFIVWNGCTVNIDIYENEMRLFQPQISVAILPPDSTAPPISNVQVPTLSVTEVPLQANADTISSYIPAATPSPHPVVTVSSSLPAGLAPALPGHMAPPKATPKALGPGVLLFDDFEQVAYDGDYDPYWWGNCQQCTGQRVDYQENGIFRFEMTADAGPIEKTLNSRLSWSPIEIGYYQLQFQLSDYEGEDSGLVTFALESELSASVHWSASCKNEVIGVSPPRPVFSCSILHVNSDGSISSEYLTKEIEVAFNTWYTARIELDANTFELGFYLDEELLGTHVPVDAELLREKQLAARFGISSPGKTDFVAFYDNVMVVAPPQSLAESSVMDDDFNDNNLNNLLWGTNIVPRNAGTILEQNQQLELSLNRENGYAGVTSKCQVSGDFDIHIDYRLLTWPPENFHSIRLVLASVEESELGHVGVYRNSYGDENYQLRSENDVVNLTTFDMNGTLRIVRQENKLFGYYAKDAEYILIDSAQTHTNPTAILIDIANSGDSQGAVSVAFDNFSMTADALDCPFLGQENNSSLQLMNDDFAEALVIENLPFTHSFDAALATTEEGEPLRCSGNVPVTDHTFWYRFTPAVSGVLYADVMSNTDVSITGYTGPSLNSLTHLGCVSGTAPFRSAIPFSFTAGNTYYLQIGSIRGGEITLTLESPPPPTPGYNPENDNFEAAIEIEDFPFSLMFDTTNATLEVGEPSLCSDNFPALSHTLWYKFTPTTTTNMFAENIVTNFEIAIVIYSGASLDSLTGIWCVSGGGQWQPVHNALLLAGTTYYLQIGSPFSATGEVTFALRQ